MLKLCVVVFLLIRVLIQGENNIKIKGLRCNGSEKYVVKNYTCFAKVYSREISTINVKINFVKPLQKLNMLLQLHYKYGVIYREVMHTPMMNWCKVIEEGSQNPMVQLVTTVMNDSAPETMEKCPLTGFFVGNRTAISKSMISAFATGDYKLMFLMFDEHLDSVFSINIIGDMKSSNRDTFG